MTHKNKHIVVVDDDLEIRQLLSQYLSKNGFDVSPAEDGETLFRLLEGVTPDLIILDIMLPGDDGFTICQRLRKSSTVPIIMLTANADDTDRIVGLEMGADDYIAKPFNPRELLARMKAILRRVQPKQSAPSGQPKIYRFGNLVLDTTSRMLVQPNGDKSAISGADYTLLCLFLEKGNEVLSRDEISDVLHGRECSPLDRSIDVHMSRLRQRLGDDAKNPTLIKTVRGSGYVLAVPVEREYGD
ncbi:response regulator [Hahella aquimaris]|uniref:response regulator n=1 Tax=Hahella sp. HNIBRBA332 TaxID=3015983 RepID=UPI00273C7E2D|nr:response regulator [Hahella sp. HNIBRBA332]WLQ13914.1 response regulator [Hahella sp. HNIBRBA332]